MWSTLKIANHRDQDGSLHLPWAETLQFTYPYTVTFIQFLGAVIILQLIAYIISAGAGYGPVYVAPDQNDFSKPVNRMLYKYGAVDSCLPAIFLAAEAVLCSKVLFHSPVELYLLSRALAIPMFFALTKLLLGLGFTGYSMPDGVGIWSSLALFASTILASYRPEILQPTSGMGTVAASSLLTAFSFLSLQRAGQMLEMSDQAQSIWRDSEDFIDSKGAVPPRISSQLGQLQQISFMVALFILPVFLFSGELGQISRNCYFVDDHLFQISFFLGVVFRCILFSSTNLLIQETSAHTALFWNVLVTVAMLPLFKSWKFLPWQIFGLAACFIVAGVFFYNSYGRLSAEASVDGNLISKRPKRPKAPPRWTVLVYAGIGCTAFIWNVWNKEDVTANSSFLPLTQSKTGYLGSRPDLDTHANFTRISASCRGDNMEYIREFRRCLDYLDSKQEDYLFLPESAPSRALPRQENDIVNNTTPTLSSSREFNTTQSSCSGPIIPYHIWWTGQPTWRTELFIKSYLFTQNVPCSVLYIWINIDQDPRLALANWTSDTRFLLLFQSLISSQSIILRPWTLPSRVRLPPLADQDELDKARTYASAGKPNKQGEVKIADSVYRDATGQLWLELYPPSKSHQIKHFTVAASDAARLIILHIYGGVYLDVDMLLLRDLRPLLLPRLPFAERWSEHEFYNNALVSLPANSSISSYIIRGGVRMGLQFHFVALHRMMRKEMRDDGNKDGLMMLENGFFDPATAALGESGGSGRCTIPCIHDFRSIFQATPMKDEWSGFDGEIIGGVPEGQNNRTMENFFRGAWAYHIHNQVSFCLLMFLREVERMVRN
jgi:hypothetical protein